MTESLHGGLTQRYLEIAATVTDYDCILRTGDGRWAGFSASLQSSVTLVCEVKDTFF